MKWSTYELNWARPLRSIITVFNNRIVHYDFFHIKSGDITTVDVINGEKIKKVKSFKSYKNVLKTQSVILEQEIRKNITNLSK